MDGCDFGALCVRPDPQPHRGPHRGVRQWRGREQRRDVSSAANFAVGALAGYGSKDVFIWLDTQVQKLFHVPEQAPDLKCKTQEAAVSRIHSKNLEVGEVTRVQSEDDCRAGTVIDQTQSPETAIDRGELVDITVAARDVRK